MFGPIQLQPVYFNKHYVLNYVLTNPYSKFAYSSDVFFTNITKKLWD